MNEDKIQIPIERIFDAVQKCRSEAISGEVAQTLTSASLLRGVMHIGSPLTATIVFARAQKGCWREAEKHVREKLPPQASLRFATTFGVDFIVSGQLPASWADDQLAKRSDLFEDVYEAEVIAARRYRWGTPTKPSKLRSLAKLQPTMDDVTRFLSDQKQTRLVYDSSRLPSLSCLAVINTHEIDPAQIWNYLDDEDQLPVRDMFRRVKDKLSMDTSGMDRSAIQHVSNYAFCEFDSIGRPEGNGAFTPAMNQAYQWRRRIVEKKEIQQVRLIPCAVINESIDYYDELQESKDRMSIFDPTVSLPYAIPGEAQEDAIPCPIWHAVICGGSRSGKSVIAYMLAGKLKERGYDVVYVNYKSSDTTTKLEESPRQKEVLEFARMLQTVSDDGINLVRPELLETTMTSQIKPAAFYAECSSTDRAQSILDAIHQVHQKRSKKAKRGIFVFFDELLNQNHIVDDMAVLETKVNQWASEGIYLGIIHQNLSSVWNVASVERVVNQSTVILGAKLPKKDREHYESLVSRAKKKPQPISPVTFEEVEGYERGQFALLPTQGAANYEHPVRGRLPTYSFLKNLGSIPEEWRWGSKVTMPSCIQ